MAVLLIPMVEYADDPRTQLDRKAEQLKWVAAARDDLVRVALLVLGDPAQPRRHEGDGVLPWLDLLGLRGDGDFIAWLMHWTWKFVLVVLLTGPIGAWLVYERIRR